MSKEKFSSFRQNITKDFHKLTKKEKEEFLARRNVIVTVANLRDSELNSTISALQEKGVTVLSLAHIAGAMISTARILNQEIPFYDPLLHGRDEVGSAGAQVLNAQKQFIRNISEKLSFTVNTHKPVLQARVEQDGKNTDVLPYVNEQLDQDDPTIWKFLSNNIYRTGCKDMMKIILSTATGIVCIEDRTLVDTDAITIEAGVDTEVLDAYRGKKYTDKIINSHDRGVQIFGVEREVIRQAQLDVRRETMQRQIDNGEIKLLPNFRRDSWPTQPLMSYIKTATIPLIEDEVRKAGVICDPQDIRYQTLFRLTTLPIYQLVHNGDVLQSYLIRQGSFTDWTKIPALDQVPYDNLPLQEENVRKVIREQLLIIKNRLTKSTLPVAKIVTPSGIFAENGWVIKKTRKDLYAFNKQSNERVPLEFREVDTDLAVKYHNDLHYIHSPRADYAFAYYIQGEEHPFSVLAAENLDRSYKQNILLAHGYDPEHCLDFTRLYSRPGTPLNTSTAIMGSVYDYLRQTRPHIQAGVSAFMPTYATGLSMISGGFETPVLVKTGKHKFQRRVIENQEVWEQVTNRRADAEGKTIESTFPMLPTIELLLRLRKPRFEPLRGVKGHMFDMVDQ